ncbi:MAG TPA: hypothetical protein VHW09_26685 [Bryobacteraceae bacterium]|jgi:hypothetical protein|nr:hypothetical protein [Bryobacteraceae bacterium]
MELCPFAHLNEDIGAVGQRLFEKYLDAQAIKWEYEAVSGDCKPDYLITHDAGQCIVEIKTVGWPEQWPSDPISPDDPVRLKIKKARRQFREYKGMPCALAVHSASMFGPSDPPTMLAAAFGPGVISSRDQTSIDPSPVFYRFPKWSDLPEDLKHLSEPLLKDNSNTTFSALILLGYHAIDSLHLEVWRRLYAKQQAGLVVEFGDQFNLLNELAPGFDRTQPPARSPRVIVIENRFARLQFPEDLFRGPFDQYWGWQGGWCGPVWIGSELESLAKEGVPFYML